MTVSRDNLLRGIPASLRRELLERYDEIASNFSQSRWGPAELDGGKFCEVVYTILNGHVKGKYPNKSKKPSNFKAACESLAELPKADFPHSIRIQIPRMLVALYTVRNDRGVGHTGGDVNPNHMDATVVLSMAKWVMAELVRVFHDVSVDEAKEAVDAMVERTVPIVWKMGDTRRVLDSSLKYLDQVLLVLYATPGEVEVGQLRQWIEHPRLANLRNGVLVPAHRERLIEYDREKGTVQLLPAGVARVEKDLPLEVRL